MTRGLEFHKLGPDTRWNAHLGFNEINVGIAKLNGSSEQVIHCCWNIGDSGSSDRVPFAANGQLERLSGSA